MTYKDEVEKLLTDKWKPTSDFAQELHRYHKNYNWTSIRTVAYMALQKLEKYRIAEHKVEDGIAYWRSTQ